MSRRCCCKACRLTGAGGPCDLPRRDLYLTLGPSVGTITLQHGVATSGTFAGLGYWYGLFDMAYASNTSQNADGKSPCTAGTVQYLFRLNCAAGGTGGANGAAFRISGVGLGTACGFLKGKMELANSGLPILVPDYATPPGYSTWSYSFASSFTSCSPFHMSISMIVPSRANPYGSETLIGTITE